MLGYHPLGVCLETPSALGVNLETPFPWVSAWRPPQPDPSTSPLGVDRMIDTCKNITFAKAVKIFAITVKGLELATSCVRDHHATTVPARHIYAEAGSLN